MSTRLARRLRAAPTIGRLAPAYATLGLLKHIVPLSRLARWAWTRQRVPRDADAERRVILAVARLRRWFGADRDCLQSSLLLYRELSRLGADPRLAIGFRRLDDRVEGHAWVFVDGRAVLGEPQMHCFEPAIQFGPGGAPVAAAANDTNPCER